MLRGCLRRTPHRKLTLFLLNQGVMLRGLAFGEHLTENRPFFLKPGCDAPGACLRRTPHRKLVFFKKLNKDSCLASGFWQLGSCVSRVALSASLPFLEIAYRVARRRRAPALASISPVAEPLGMLETPFATDSWARARLGRKNVFFAKAKTWRRP